MSNHISPSSLSSSSLIFHPGSPGYPERLRALNPQPTLYARGGEASPRRPVIGVIGSRKPSNYGVGNTINFIKTFLDDGCCICAQLEEGISSIALHTAIRSEYSGVCMALCHSGIDRIFTSKFKPLAIKIEKFGHLYSQYSDNQSPEPQFVKESHRLMATLCDILLVVESPLNSHLTHLIQWGLELGKSVCTIPGPINNSNYLGNHYLIQNGAKLVQFAEDVIAELNY